MTQMTTRLTCLATVVAAGIALITANGSVHARGDRHHFDDTEKSSARITKEGTSTRERSDRHKRDDHKHKEAKGCRRHCNDDVKKAVPVTVVGSVGKTVVRVRDGEVLGFESNTAGSITIVEHTTTPGVLRTVSVGGNSITLSSRTADALRLTGSNGKPGNIAVGANVSVKQNPDGSITVTATQPPGGKSF